MVIQHNTSFPRAPAMERWATYGIVLPRGPLDRILIPLVATTLQNVAYRKAYRSSQN